MSSIDRNSPIPLYYQIAMDLRARIKWEWGYGVKLPNEPDLAEEYGTSRMTVRQALAELVKEGMLIRQRAKGTFVRDAPKSYAHTLTFPMSFSSRFQAQGMVGRTKLIHSEVHEVASSEISKHLEIELGTKIATFQRVLMVNDEGVAINRSVMPEALCPGITEAGLINGSISTTLSDRYDLHPAYADDWIEAAHARKADATLLDTFPGAPLLLVITLSRLGDGTPLEFSRTLWNTDKMRLHIQLNTSNATTVGP